MSVAKSLAWAASTRNGRPASRRAAARRVSARAARDLGRHVGQHEAETLEVDDRAGRTGRAPWRSRRRSRAPPGPAPTAQAAMPSRPASSALIAIRKPVPSSPTSRSTPTRAPSKAICATGEERSPIVCSRRCGTMPGSGRVGEQARDAVRAGPAGTAEHVVVVGHAGMRDPGLRAVHDVLVAVAYGPRRQRCGVRAALGFGEAVRPEQLAAEHVGQEALALGVAPGGGDRVAGQRVRRRRPRPRRATARPAPRSPAGRPGTADLRRRTPPGTAGPAARPDRASAAPRGGTRPAASNWATRGASSPSASSRVSSSSAAASSLGSSRSTCARSGSVGVAPA